MIEDRMRFQNALPSSIFDPRSSIFSPFALSVFRAYIHLKNALDISLAIFASTERHRAHGAKNGHFRPIWAL